MYKFLVGLCAHSRYEALHCIKDEEVKYENTTLLLTNKRTNLQFTHNLQRSLSTLLEVSVNNARPLLMIKK